MPATAAEEMFDAVEGYVRDAFGKLESGQYTELRDLQGKVQILCDAVRTMPPEEARLHANRLNDLGRQLDLLTQVMVQHRERVQDSLSGLADKKRASHAYARSDSMLGKRTEDTDAS